MGSRYLHYGSDQFLFAYNEHPKIGPSTVGHRQHLINSGMILGRDEIANPWVCVVLFMPDSLNPSASPVDFKLHHYRLGFPLERRQTVTRGSREAVGLVEARYVPSKVGLGSGKKEANRDQTQQGCCLHTGSLTRSASEVCGRNVEINSGVLFWKKERR